MTNKKDTLNPDNFEWDMNEPAIPVTDEDMFRLFQKNPDWKFEDPEEQKKFEAWKGKQPKP